MPVNYYELGGHKRLNEVVIAGSHDAGITSGGSAAKTQDLTIGAQAAAGVRVFDLRIAAVVTKSSLVLGTPKEVELKAFHGGITKTKDANVAVAHYHPGTTTTLTASKAMPGTAFGEGLYAMLGQARGFVESPAGQTEFLILKFDKCQNYGLIGEVCRDVLGDRIFKGGGNLNNRTLDELRGKVVTLFPPSALAEMGGHGAPHGMLPFKNLAAKGAAAYDARHDGLQYYGKGGTKPANEINKIAQNVSKQTKLMAKAKSLQNPHVVGMLYWTTTGTIWNIKKRNEKMWKNGNLERFAKLWAAGLGDYLDVNVPFVVPDGSPAVGPLRKRFMPNIVMVDFADAVKCQVIRDLNDLSPEALAMLS